MPEAEGFDLPSARSEIDDIDAQIVALLGRRIGVCRRVAAHKRQNGIEMMQPERVREVGERVERLAEEHGLDPAFVRRLYDLIIDAACRIEDAIIADGDAPADAATSLLGRSAKRIDHVAIAVRDLEAAIATYRERFGFTLVERRTVKGSFSGMTSAVMEAGGVTFVLVQGDSPESNVSRYIEHYGPGVQHVALEVEGPEALVDDLRGRGCDLLTGVIHGPGLDQVFTKRDANSGMQLELVTRVDRTGFDERNVQQLFEAMERENVY